VRLPEFEISLQSNRISQRLDSIIAAIVSVVGILVPCYSDESVTVENLWQRHKQFRAFLVENGGRSGWRRRILELIATELRGRSFLPVDLFTEK
jgi:hypothetical protein